MLAASPSTARAEQSWVGGDPLHPVGAACYEWERSRRAGGRISTFPVIALGTTNRVGRWSGRGSMTLLIDAVTADPKDRRMMLVASDDKLKSIVSRVLGQSYLNLVVGWPLRAVLQPGMGFLADRLLQEDPPHGPLTQLAVSCVRRELPYPRISLRQANHPPFKFDVGHVPEDGALYVQHPCFQDRYVPPALVNDLLAREKLGAFRQIAASLAAKRRSRCPMRRRRSDWERGSIARTR